MLQLRWQVVWVLGAAIGLLLINGCTIRSPATPVPRSTSNVNALAYTPDGETLVAGYGASQDHTIRLWHVTPPLSQRTLTGYPGAVSGVAISPDGHWLAAATEGCATYLWRLPLTDTQPILLQASYSAAPKFTGAVAFNPRGSALALACNNQIHVWDNPATSQISTITFTTPSTITLFTVAFMPDGQQLVGAYSDGQARLWRLADPGDPTMTLRGDKNYIQSIAISPDGSWLATGGYEGNIRLWNLRVLQQPPITLPQHQYINDSIGSVFALAFSPDGHTLASGGINMTVLLWPVQQLPATPIALTGGSSIVTSLAFSPDGRTLAVGGTDNAIHIWDIAQPSKTPQVIPAP